VDDGQISRSLPQRGLTSWPLSGVGSYYLANDHIEGNARFDGFMFMPNICRQQQHNANPSGTSYRIDDDQATSSLLNESAIGSPSTALPVASSVQLQGGSNFAGTRHPSDDHLDGPEFGWEMSKHVFGSPVMNGGLLPLTNGFQFASTGSLGHELSFPMQTHEATFMQSQPDGTNVWGDAGPANASPYNGQGSAPLYVPNTSPQLPTIIPCSYPTCNKTFKRDADRSRHEYSVHFKNSGLHLCPIVGCPKSYGKGYSRPDKITEHLWKKHANLGFTKA
jgi:hypothetical protein